jgi:hypothetical protein
MRAIFCCHLINGPSGWCIEIFRNAALRCQSQPSWARMHRQYAGLPQISNKTNHSVTGAPESLLMEERT